MRIWIHNVAIYCILLSSLHTTAKTFFTQNVNSAGHRSKGGSLSEGNHLLLKACKLWEKSLCQKQMNEKLLGFHLYLLYVFIVRLFNWNSTNFEKLLTIKDQRKFSLKQITSGNVTNCWMDGWLPLLLFAQDKLETCLSTV